MKEIMRWIQGLGAGILVSIGDAVMQAVNTATPSAAVGTLDYIIQTFVIMVLVRVAGWIVSKIPAPAPAPDVGKQ